MYYHATSMYIYRAASIQEAAQEISIPDAAVSSFYERYGWQSLCMAQGDGEPEPSRMYVHHWRA